MIFLYFVFFVFGSAVGSFLNVVVDRTMKNESIVYGRSYCDFCHHPLSTFDLFPVLSFMGLRARCRYCHHKLSWQYPLVETAVGVLFILAFNFLATSGSLSPFLVVYTLVVLSALCAVFIFDFKYSLIPTTFVFASSLVVLFKNYFFLTSGDFVLNVFSAFALAIFFLVVVLVTRGRGMGTGDIPLVFLLGLFLGWPNNLAAVFLSFLSGAVVSILLLIFGRKKFGQTIPFGPFLIGSAIAVLFWGEQIIGWYFRLL